MAKAIRRVFFVAPLWPGGSCDARARGLERIGLSVEPLDCTAWCGTSVWQQRIAARFCLAPSILRMNRELERVARKLGPDLVWIDKGNWVFPSTLKRVRQSASFLVHYNTDDIFSRAQRFVMMRRGLKLFDLHLTTNRFNVAEIPQFSGVRALRVGMGFDGERHRAPSLPPESVFQGVVFVGHWEPHTEAYVAALCDAGVPVRLWGPGWHHATRPIFRRTAVLPRPEYNLTIAGARLALCSLSRSNRNETTGRSFEIPALGACLLAERTAEHEYLYREGEEALFFGSADELVCKAMASLRAPAGLDKIAAKGRARCLRLGLSWEDHMAREWPIIERLLHRGEVAQDGSDDAPFWPGYRLGVPYGETRHAVRTGDSEVGDALSRPLGAERA